MNNLSRLGRLAAFTCVATVAGCTVHPVGEQAERDAAKQMGKPFESRSASKQMMLLPTDPTPEQLVQYAMVNNAELEQRYWDWRAAIEQIPQDGEQTANLNLAGGTAITHGRDSWGSSTLALSNDPMTDIKWPGKLDAAAKASLANARAAGERFIQAKFNLRRNVLSAYDDYSLTAELIRLQKKDQLFLQTALAVTQSRNRSGGSDQADVLRAENEADLAGNDLANLESQLQSQRAVLKAVLGAPADAVLPVPDEIPPRRVLAMNDSQLFDDLEKQNPALIADTEDALARGEGVRLARLQYVPDFNLSIGTDLAGVTQSLLGQVTVPFLRYEAINAAIEQAEATLHASEAMRRHEQNDLAARASGDIYAIRDDDRQTRLIEQSILPRANEIADVGRAAYGAGRATLLEVVADERSLIAFDRLDANLKTVRDKDLLDLESIAAADLSK